MILCACGGANVKDTAQADAQLVVLDIGGLPRQRLRLQPVLHAKERFAVEIQTRMEGAYTDTTFQTRHGSGSAPAVRVTGTYEVTAIAPTGDAVVAMRIDGVAGTASWRVSPVGAVSDIAVPDESPAWRAQREMLETSTAIFPEGEVGVGARWQLTSRVRFGGVTWDRKISYALRDVTDTAFMIDAVAELRAESQAISVEPNRTTRLTSATAHSSSEAIIPRRGLTTTWTAIVSGELNLQIVQRRARVTSTLHIETTLATKPL